MKTDRELLELAAKAAGVAHIGYVNGAKCNGLRVGKGYVWNPLEDDGDAFRLMVYLALPVNPEFGKGGISVGYSTAQVIYDEKWDGSGAQYRRAIVRAAAAMGERV